ncbi:membrane associated rhomboid family serine protease [Halorubrum trapanicum]|uniref:Membrane associated rhomboid family serine protease n=1 Tax=Halorubrum trapanicum TaxID=29284 RepID=A0A8J7R5Y3_9EURY|nr:rhomboid family protein [Halorubrum trapanicum]MBP1900377.1 membrane associated rhomboid family serine protease [Halorubrum trapanicum]
MVAEALTSDAVHLAAGAAGVAVALVAVYLIDRPAGEWTRALRSRLLLGVPWGTLVVIAGVIAVYLFVQSGIDDPNRPVVIPFRSWSYFYPEGLLWSSFAHSSRGHITGNLLSALVAGGLAEYAYGHFPDGRDVDDGDRLGVRLRRFPGRLRGVPARLRRLPSRARRLSGRIRRLPSRISAVESPGSNPYVRAFLIVPGAAVAFGLVSALFALGPVIGFSVVVFAYWGFALVSRPIAAVVAMAGTTLVGVLYDAVRVPVAFAEASPSYGAPSWANIAIQGHALGLIGGALIAVLLLRRRARKRDETSRGRSGIESDGDATAGRWRFHPTAAASGDGSAADATESDSDADATERSALVVFGALLLFGASRRLWAVYWYLGNEQYELYRAVGVGLLGLLAAIVAVAAVARDDPLWPARATPDPETLRAGIRSATPAAVGLLLLVAALAVVAGPGVVPNLVTVDDGDLPGEPVEVEGYQVTYAENVENQLVGVVDVEAFGRSTSVNTSGVIVSDPDREIWTTAVSKGNLAFWGYRAVDVGGTGWRETVWVQRVGWVAANDGSTYRVDAVRNETRRTLFTSEPARAEPRIDGRNVTVAATRGGFELRVTGPVGNASAPLPAANESVTLRGVTFVQRSDAVFAVRGETRVRIAQRETYEGRQ